MIMDVSRTFGCDNAMKNYELLKQFPSKNIIGIGLGGAESKGPAKDFAPVYDLAIKEGYVAVAHAGEDVGPESIWDSLNYLHAQRIGHGLTACQDEELMKSLEKSKTPIEICITSNTFTKKIVQKAKDHPVKMYFDRGISVNINTDDPVFFKTTLINEYWLCHHDLNFTMDEIKQLVKNSFLQAFMSDKEKKDYCQKVDQAWSL